MGKGPVRLRARPGPDLFTLSVDPELLLHRALIKYGHLDYWESGMDVGLSSDMFDSFTKYQTALKNKFDELDMDYGFDKIDGQRPPVEVQEYNKEKVSALLNKKTPAYRSTP